MNTDGKKRIRSYIGYYSTKTEALRALALYKINPSERSNIKLSVIYDEWSGIKYSQISKSMQDVYRYEIEMYNPNLMYAFYLYKDDERIDFKDYSNDNFYEFTPKELGKYTVKWFVVRDSVKDKWKEPIGSNKQSGMFEQTTIVSE